MKLNDTEAPAEPSGVASGKKAYSAPRLTNLGAVHGIVLHSDCVGFDSGSTCSASGNSCV